MGFFDRFSAKGDNKAAQKPSGGPARPKPAAAPAPSAATAAPKPQQPEPAPIPAGQRIIQTFEQVPANSGLLTMGPHSVYRVPDTMRTRIVAIELGPKRAALLYEPTVPSDPKAKQVLTQLRAQLASKTYSVEGGDLLCHKSVLEKMVSDWTSRSGSSDNHSANAVHNEAAARFHRWLEIACRSGATDLHIQIVGGRGLVQVRVDGELEMLRDENGGIFTEKEATDSMAAPFNNLAAKGSNSSSQWTADKNLYCMTQPVGIDDRKIALRYQSLKGFQGPKMIARLLNVDTSAPTLSYSTLGYATSQRMQLLSAANTPSGFVLIAGVTGSGKTTTLKTFVETHPGNGSMAFYSMEDPVEYPMRGVHQIVLQRDVANKQASKGMFNETVAALMRADPDAAIVGEIRDDASAGAGQQLVETGHMALGTVHAHLLTGIMPRLTNSEIGMSRDVLTNPNMLTALMYQALVPKVCPHCCFDAAAAMNAARIADAAAPDTSFQEHYLGSVLKNIKERFKMSPDTFRFKNPEGCSKCSTRGTKGVTVVAEICMPDREWLDYSRVGDDYGAMVHYRQASDRRFDTPNMDGKTIFEHTLYKAMLGGVDPRQCDRFDTFQRFELAPQVRKRGVVAVPASFERSAA